MIAGPLLMAGHRTKTNQEGETTNVQFVKNDGARRPAATHRVAAGGLPRRTRSPSRGAAVRCYGPRLPARRGRAPARCSAGIGRRAAWWRALLGGADRREGGRGAVPPSKVVAASWGATTPGSGGLVPRQGMIHRRAHCPGPPRRLSRVPCATAWDSRLSEGPKRCEPADGGTPPVRGDDGDMTPATASTEPEP